MRNEEVLQRVKQERNILRTAKRRKGNWIGHVLRGNCLLKHVIEGKIIRTGRLGRRLTQLVNNLKEKRGYCQLQEESLDRTEGTGRRGRRR